MSIVTQFGGKAKPWFLFVLLYACDVEMFPFACKVPAQTVPVLRLIASVEKAATERMELGALIYKNFVDKAGFCNGGIQFTSGNQGYTPPLEHASPFKAKHTTQQETNKTITTCTNAIRQLSEVIRGSSR
ncbi:hypothetical protein JRQ81_010863, partial [Phrynocephalus forsythii]